MPKGPKSKKRRKYYDHFFFLLKQWPKLNSIPSSTRSYCFRIAESEGPILKWYATVELPERIKINYPGTVWHKFMQTKKPIGAEKKPSAYAKMKEENVRLQEELDEKERQLRRGERIDWQRDSIPKIAKIIAEELGTAQLVFELADELKDEAERIEAASHC